MNRFAVPLVLMALLGGCHDEPAARTLPRLNDVQSRLPPTAAPEPLAPSAQTRVAMIRIDLAGELSLQDAWDVVRLHGVQPAIDPVWRDNGLRAGILHVSLLDAFLKALPKAQASQRLSLLTSATPLPINITPTFREPHTVTVTSGGGDRSDVELLPGATRLLMTTEPQPDGAIQIALTPHHYRPRPSVKPRTMIQQQLDGILFDRLQLQTTLKRDNVLILGVYHPSASKTPSTQPAATQPTIAEAQVVTEPLRLGRLILEGMRHQHSVQVLLVLQIEP